MKIKPLESYYSEDGEPGKKILRNELLDIGSYDSSIGTEREYFLRNPNFSIIFDISKLKIEHPHNYSFHAVAKVYPLETIKCTIQVKPVDNTNIENFDLSIEKEAIAYSTMLKAMQEKDIHIKVVGEVRWEQMTVVVTDTTKRRYGDWH